MAANPEALQVISPAEAVMLVAFAKLVAHLERKQILLTGEFAELLAVQADALPPQCRSLLKELAESLRPLRGKMRLLVRDENEGDQGAD